MQKFFNGHNCLLLLVATNFFFTIKNVNKIFISQKSFFNCFQSTLRNPRWRIKRNNYVNQNRKKLTCKCHHTGQKIRRKTDKQQSISSSATREMTQSNEAWQAKKMQRLGQAKFFGILYCVQCNVTTLNFKLYYHYTFHV